LGEQSPAMGNLIHFLLSVALNLIRKNNGDLKLNLNNST
jgi:hypothetical protein